MRTTIFAVLLGLSLTACNNDTNQYNSGYEGAWNGEEEPSSIWSNKKQRSGYQDGLDDADKNKYKPKYFKDAFYMDGFKDWKKQR